MQTELKIKVLVADDNHINRMLINKMLTKWGITTDFAENGLQAINKIETNPHYDAVLMDIYMPEMGGIEATQHIRAKQGAYFQELPIIAITASLLSHEITEITNAGMNGYILKPFEPAVLYNKLSSYRKVNM